MADPSLVRFRTVVQRSLAELEARREEVNDLNVFPVADGDTGDNMALTLRAVLDELDRLQGEGALDEIGRDEIVDSVARAALLGARGNSGVILSQLIRGAAEELASRPGELVDPVLIGAAMARAADRAYDSVREPAEGTILTVVREMAHRVASELAHMDEPRLEQDDADAPGRADRRGARARARRRPAVGPARARPAADPARGRRRRRRRLRPDRDPRRRRRGAARHGGARARPARARRASRTRSTSPRRSATARTSPSPARAWSPSTWVDTLESIGDSVLVVGDQRTLKVHVHTDEPERATALFAGVGAVSRLDVADMHEQVQQRFERLAEPTAACGVVAVVAGKGMEDLFTSLGATPLPGGPTLNPSTYELLAGIHDVPAEEVVVLPNSPNVLMAAERAAELSDKRVYVVPTRSQQAGLAAAVALDPARDAVANGEAMLEALALVRTGAVTGAARDDAEERPARFHRGDAVGFIDERLVAWGEPAETLEAVLGELGREAELVTLIAGDGAPLDGDAASALAPSGVELEYSWGGQPAYWWLIAAE